MQCDRRLRECYRSSWERWLRAPTRKGTSPAVGAIVSYRLSDYERKAHYSHVVGENKYSPSWSLPCRVVDSSRQSGSKASLGFTTTRQGRGPNRQVPITQLRELSSPIPRELREATEITVHSHVKPRRQLRRSFNRFGGKAYGETEGEKLFEKRWKQGDGGNDGEGETGHQISQFTGRS
eukprot:GHVN01102197.1.p1 GENE.GHVN01102197.1~~GHVN01102197.1.p1  ORF type:complete len:179 (-),score=16.44 GHVN01102197.1:97-633(-)